ncbi:hypothetical protein HanRHA438_Chr17g0810671 [Helianthus annuus]|nr:hypothetical protein HanRHA438_Chr17g0810671 [Helianthus annuus]
MGLHLLIGFCKLHGVGAPFLATLAWPFFVKVCMSLTPFKNVLMNMAQDSRLLVFQLSQIIVFQEDEGGTRRRCDRIIQLVHQRWPNIIGQSMPFSNYDQSLQALSIAAF